MSTKAEESPQVKKARKKLEKQVKKENKLINQAAIEQMKKAIQVRIKRQGPARVPLAEKSVELFDENRHPATAKSKHVKQLLHQLKTEASKSLAFKPLIGRIKK